MPWPSDRTAFYDRNATTILKSVVSSSVGPHGGTNRWTYTVPTGRKASVQGTRNFVQRTAAAAPVGQVQSYFNFLPAAGGAGQLGVIELFTNTVNDGADQTWSSLGDLLAGDGLTGSDSDASTGGTVTFTQTAKIVEYDG